MLKKRRLVCILSLLIVGVIAISFHFYAINKHTFTIEKWNTNIYSREVMIDDLIKKHTLKGMRKDDVLKILGKEGLVPDSELTYYVGKDLVGPVLFIVSFDENGRVKNYGVVVD